MAILFFSKCVSPHPVLHFAKPYCKFRKDWKELNKRYRYFLATV